MDNEANTEQSQEESKTPLLPGNQNDGNVAVVFSEDNLEVRADFYPPMGNGQHLRADIISEALTKRNIVYGILWDTIQESVTTCNLNHKILRDVTIVRGDPPVKEVLEYFQMNPALKIQPPEAAGNAQLDYKSWSPFIIVKKGQALAKQKSRKEGRDGKDIHGQAIPHGTIKPKGVSGGAHTRIEGRYMYAEINGQLIEAGDTLSVQESLEIKGGVDYRTGNIVFPGDITIDGPVSDGFKIYSGGSVTIKQTFDVTDVITKTDLTVMGGIIGRGRALVKVGGALTAKFIENCSAAVRKTISVDADIVNSSVYTMESLEMGEKGKILGGEIYAVKGVRTGAIGKKLGKPTHIHCGLDFTAQQEKEKCNNTLRILAAKLAKLRELLSAESAENPERRTKMEEALARLEDEQKKTSANAAAILVRLNADETAVVEVTGEIAPGTLIEICQIALFVSEPLQKVRIRLDRGLGKLVSEPL